MRAIQVIIVARESKDRGGKGMSKSAEIYKEDLPYNHPFARDYPPSKAARSVAEAFPKREHGQRIIVDAGCGEGRNTLSLLDEGFHVVAIDASERNLGIVSQKVAEARIAADMFAHHVADLVGDIPIESATADVVLDVWVLGSVILPYDGRTGAKQYLAEVHRILKPGGLFVSEFETLKPRRSSDELRKYLANLVKGYFSITASEAIDTDYSFYLDVPYRGKVRPALFAVARKQ